MLLIIGAGQAAARLVEHVRAGGYTQPITLVGDEPDLPYERPALSKAVLIGEQHPSSLEIHNASFYERAGVRVLLGERCVSLDVHRKQVTVASGETLDYSTCVLATGARARSLPELSGVPGMQSIRSIKDTVRLGSLLMPGRRLMVVGGGFLGLEAASSARQLGLDVTVVHAAPTLLNRVLPPSLGANIQAVHESQGVRVVTGAAVASIIRRSEPENGIAYVVELTNGQRHWVDIVLESVGSIANDELAQSAGIECDNGVICDEHCRTSVPDVLAIGDCARAVNRFDGVATRYESWQAAELHAKVAAATLLGTPSALNEVPWFWTDQANFNLQFLGSLQGEGSLYTRELRASKPSSITFGVDEKGVLRGAALMNAGKFRRVVSELINSRVPVDIAALSDAAVAIPSLALRTEVPMEQAGVA